MGGQPRKKRCGGDALEASAGLASDAKVNVETVLKSLSHVDEGELEHVLNDLETEVENRCKRLKLDAESCIMSLQNTFHVELMRIPKSVRQMSLRAFCKQYGEDIRSVLRSAVEEETSKVISESEKVPTRGVPVTGTVVKAPPPSSRSLRSASRGASSRGVGAQTPSTSRATRSGRAGQRAAAGAQTPMVKGSAAMAGTPAIRPVRHGESILSANGSPLQVDTTGGDQPTVKAGVGEDGSSSMVIELPIGGSVTAVDILRNPESVSELDESAREEVQKRIEALQNGLATVLKQIQQKPGTAVK